MTENGGILKQSFNDFVTIHGSQLETSGVPQHVWPSLNLKLENQVYDSGEKFMLTYIESEAVNTDDDDATTNVSKVDAMTENSATPDLKVVVSHEDGVLASDIDSIFLIDHAWTYRLTEARKQLTEVPGLLERMMSLMNLGQVEQSDVSINKVIQESWKFSRTYRMSTEGLPDMEKQSVWYIVDEFGSRIRHSDSPSCRMIPFYYVPLQAAYSLLFPIQDLKYGDDVTVDFAFSHDDPIMRKIHLLPWQPCDLSTLETDQGDHSEDYYRRVCNSVPPEVTDPPVLRDTSGQLKVYCDVQHIIESLKHPKFVFVDTEDEADVLFVSSTLKDYRKISNETHQFVNQFPGEKLITNKDMLAVVSRQACQSDRTAMRGPKWLPVTFDLVNSLPQFVSYFQQQQKKGAPNVWILKPFNLARALDSTVTNNLSEIIRQTETDIPKVACEYITDPVLFQRDGIGRVKFDLRFIVLLKSVKPLCVYVYKIYWTRFANKPFTLEEFDDYCKHFTVMNYITEGPGENFYQVLWHEFTAQFSRQFPGYEWLETEAKIYDMIREFFQAACSRPPPRGLQHCPWSGAMYGLDVMLRWDTNHAGEKIMQPVLLECNFMPDCVRACWHRGEFFDDVFSTLFLGDVTDRPVQKL